MVCNFREGDKWTSSKIVDQLGPVSYLVQCSDGSMWQRHVDHILEKTSSSQLDEPQTSHASSVSSEYNSDSVNDATFQSSTTDIAATNSQPEATSSQRLIPAQRQLKFLHLVTLKELLSHSTNTCEIYVGGRRCSV